MCHEQHWTSFSLAFLSRAQALVEFQRQGCSQDFGKEGSSPINLQLNSVSVSLCVCIIVNEACGSHCN